MLQVITSRDVRTVRGGPGIEGRAGVLYQVDTTGALFVWDASAGVMRGTGSQGLAEPHAGYVFYLPGRQGVGVPVDRSGKGRNAIRKAGLTEAQCWSTAGYMATVGDGAGNDNGIIAVVDPAVAIDYSQDVAVISVRFKMAQPAANAPIFGLGINQAGPHGPYVSARTSGKVLVGIAHADGAVYSTGELGNGVVFDGTEHAIGLYIDGPNKNMGVYLDGGLAFTAPQNSFGGSSVAATGFAFGAAYYLGVAQESTAAVMREAHYLKLPSMPLNLDDIMLQLATSSGPLLTSDVRTA